MTGQSGFSESAADLSGTGSRELPPGPRPYWPFSLHAKLRRDPLSLLTELATTYGDIVGVRFRGFRIYLVSDPALIQEILVTNAGAYARGKPNGVITRTLGQGLLTSDGDLHRQQRRAVQPMFHAQRINGYGMAMVDEAEQLAGSWQPGLEIDVASEMSRLARRVVGRTLFGADVGGSTDQLALALATVLEFFDRALLPFAGLVERLPLSRNREFHDAERVLDQTVRALIAQRKTEPGQHDDLLAHLMAAATGSDGTSMSDRQVRDEVMTLFLAGHETTAGALAWTWYLLALNPEVRARLNAEVDTLIGKRPIRPDDLIRLSYTGRVLTEAMRLYPPGWFLGREAARDTRLGDYSIPKGSSVIVSQWVVHRDARWFADPLRFDPDRWLPERAAGHPRFDFFPFGGGSRKCLGEQFARMEATLTLATIAQRWQLQLVPGQQVDPLPRVTLRPPRQGIRMVVEERLPQERARVSLDS